MNDNLILQNGKYKDEDVRDVYFKDPDYIKYLYYQPSIKYEKDIYEFVLNKIYPNHEREIFMDFGKYKGKPLSYILKKKDIKYLLYLHGCSFIKKNNKKLYKILDFLLNNIKLEENYY